MSFYDAIRVGASGAAADFEIDRSLRFNDDDSAHLSRTPSSAGNRKTFTWSAWIKRGELGATQGRCFGGGVSGSDYFEIYFPSDDGLRVIWYQGGQTLTTTTAKFRDPSAWYHFVVAVDTTQSTAGDRIKMYRNNVLLERDSTNPSQNLDTSVNNTVEHNIGKYLTGGASYFDGYMAEINFVDGNAYDPSYFGETNLETGQWIPKRPSVTYGTNGFRLNFSDNSGTTATTLGKDLSGNGNNFTPNNFAVSDSITDTPSKNFCTLNPLNKTNDTDLREGNLEFFQSSNDESASATFGITSGKWYWEVYKNSSQNPELGIETLVRVLSNKTDIHSNTKVCFRTNGGDQTNGAGSAISLTGSSSGQTGAGVIAIAVDFDNKKIWYSDLSGSFFNSGNPATGSNAAFDFSSVAVANGCIPYVFIGTGGNNSCNVNFGQDGTFAGHTTAGGYADGNGHGNFKYSVPSGYLALCSANLPDPTILLPNKHFDTLLWTANASTQSITGLNFSPDWVWGKSRDDSYDHEVYDTVRGPLKRLKPNATDQELTNAGNLTSFDSNGFTLGSATNMNYNSGSDIVAWNWDAGETDSATYRVVVVSDSGNKYRFRNSANTATFAQSAVTLDLAEGGTYTFDQSDSTMSSHPMKLSTTANGTHGGGSSYNTGVTYQLDGSSVTESAFVSGFSSATSRKLIITVAASAPTLYYYCHYHSGMGGQANTNSTLGSSNFDGSTQTIVKANTTAGFSIVSYTGNDTSGSTIGHGLGAVPQITIIKRRIAAEDWMFGIGHILGSGKEGHYIKLNATEPEGTGNGPFASTNSSSTVVTIGSDVAVNDNGEPYICYCFSEVAGYSKFGLYEGNGSSSDGTFIFTGFRPAFFICKAISFTKGWRMTDSKRAPFNPIYKSLFPELTAAEYTATGTNEQGQDFVSNGVKLRSTNTRDNQNGSTYFFMAFAESPFKNSRAR